MIFNNLFGSIRARFIVVISIAVLMPLIITQLVEINLTRNSLTEQLAQQNESLANFEVIEVSELLQAQVDLFVLLAQNDNIEALARVRNVSRYRDIPEEQIQADLLRLDSEWAVASNEDDLVADVLDNVGSNVLLELLSVFTQYSEVIFTDVNGGVIAATGRTSDYYQADEEWWQVAYNNGEGSVYISQQAIVDENTNTTALQIAVPIYNDATNEIIGILRATYDVETIITVLESVAVGETGQVLLVNAEGNQVLLSEDEAGLQIPADLLTSNSNDSGLQSFTNANAERFIYATAPLNNSSDAPYLQDLNWYVVVIQSQQEAFALISEQFNLIVSVAIISVIFAIVLAIWVGRSFSQPLIEMTNTARTLGERQDWSLRMDSSRTDELGELAQSFNTMASQVETAINTVETRSRFLESTVEVGTLVNSIRHQDELLPAVTNYIQQQFDLYYAQIYLLDDTKRYAILRVGTGIVGEQLVAAGHRLDMTGRSLVAESVQTRAPVLVVDTDSNESHLPNPLLPDTRSEISIPLLAGNDVLGVLDMQDNTAGRFNDDNLGVFVAMASQVASAVFGARAYEEIEAAVQRAENLNERITSSNWRSYLGKLSDSGRVQVEFNAYGKSETTFFNDDIKLYDLFDNLEDKQSLMETIKLGEQNIGQIVVREGDHRDWTEEEKNLLHAAANQLARAAEQFRAFDETEIARKRSANLYNISQDLAEANTLDEILPIILAEDVLENVTSASIILYELDEKGQPDWVNFEATEGDNWFKTGTRRLLATFPMGQLLTRKRNEPLLISNIHGSEHVDDDARDMLQEQGISSIALIPIKQARMDIGVIAITWKQIEVFTNEERFFLRSIMTPLSTTINNMRLLDQTQRRALEMETVAQVTTTASSQLELSALLQSVSDLTKGQFDLYHTHIYLLDENDNLVIAGGAGAIGEQMVAQGHRISLTTENSLVAKAARTGRGVIIDDVTLSPDFLPNPLLPDTRSEIAVPMLIGDEVIGVLDAQSRKVARFDISDTQVYNTLARQVAVAVENARAFQREQATVERLREIDQLKSQFLANMSHELRTPLNSIIGYASILIDGAEGELPEDVVMDIDIIHQSGRHLLSIINDILDLAKIEAKGMTLRMVPTKIEQVIEEVVRSGKVLAEEKGITLTVVQDSEVGQVAADSVRMRQIIWNLASNAMKFTEQGGVTIRYGMHTNDDLYVRIEDTGIGIPEEQLGQVFERFSQVDESSTRSAGGTGLGLTITRELIQMHGGEVYLESEVGVGSTFWFTIPIITEDKTEVQSTN